MFEEYRKGAGEEVAKMLDPDETIFVKEFPADDESFGEEAMIYREKAEEASAIITSGGRSSEEWEKVRQLLSQACQAAYDGYHKLPYYHKRWPEEARKTATRALCEARAALAYVQGHEAGRNGSAL